MCAYRLCGTSGAAVPCISVRNSMWVEYGGRGTLLSARRGVGGDRPALRQPERGQMNPDLGSCYGL